MLDAAEDASPVEAVEAVTQVLGAALGATAVSFLISDLSGRGLVRLARQRGDTSDAEDTTVGIPSAGGPAEQAIRTQSVQVLPPRPRRGKGPLALEWKVLAPVRKRIGATEVAKLGFKMPFYPVANYLVLAFLAGVVVLMGFLPDFRYALYVAPVWVAILYLAYRIKTAAAVRAMVSV